MAFPAFEIFQNFPGEDPRTPPYKGNTSIKPSKSFFDNNSSQRQKKKEPESPPHQNNLQEIYLWVIQKLKKGKLSPLKQSTRNLSLGYTEIGKKEKGAGARSFFVICNWAV